MIRAAAKNNAFAAVLVDPADYAALLAELRESDGRLSLATRAAWPRTRSRRTARYDAAISTWFASRESGDGSCPARRASPTRRSWTCVTARTPTSAPPSTRAPARPRTCSHGVRSSTARSCRSTTCSTSASARELVEEFDGPACAIVKHNNPCGCAVGDDVRGGLRARLRLRPAERLRRRDRGQPPRRRAAAEQLARSSSRSCSRPGYEPEALGVLQQKKNVRLLELAHWPAPDERGRRQAGARRPAGAGPRRGRGDARADAGPDRQASRASRSGRTCCSPGWSAATCAPTRS